MKSPHQKRILLGLLAFVAPLPLPFNEPRPMGVVGFGFLSFYLLAVSIFLLQVKRRRSRWLPRWSLNVLGAAYLPFLAVDLTSMSRMNLVGPMMHLVLFALLAKLFSLEKESHKWHAVFGIFFVFLTSMATSSHPAIVLYLAVFVALAVMLLTRFAQLHVIDSAGFNMPGTEIERRIRPTRSLAGFLAVAILFTLGLGLPLFVSLPRLKDPYVLGQGGQGHLRYITGFSDDVSLDVIGNVRASREVALRTSYEEDVLPGMEMRFKGAAYDHYTGRAWRKSGMVKNLERKQDSGFELAKGESLQTMNVWLARLNATSLILPMEALAVDVESPTLLMSRGGSVSLVAPPKHPLSYKVVVASEPVMTAAIPPVSGAPSLSIDGVDERIQQLARDVAGDGPPSEVARNIEKYLAREYEYTLDFMGRDGIDPIGDFLFVYGSGHCEYFATAMVLMLRSVGIPARFVSGYLGAESSPLEGSMIVRQSNAHAWVEAYLPEEGWRIFDPTPPAGRPIVQPMTAGMFMRQVYDYVLYRWDRYIISYGLDDQSRFFARLKAAWRQFVERLSAAGAAASQRASATADALANAPTALWARVLAVVVAALGLVLLVRRLWPTRSATQAYRSLLRKASRRGLVARRGTTPGQLCARIAQAHPDVAAQARRLVDLYLAESFGGRRTSAHQLRELSSLLRFTASSIGRST